MPHASVLLVGVLVLSQLARANLQCNTRDAGPEGACSACPAGKYKDFDGSFLCTTNDLLLTGARNHTFLDCQWMHIWQFDSRPMYMQTSGNYYMFWSSFRWLITFGLPAGLNMVLGGHSQTFPNNTVSVWTEEIVGLTSVSSTTLKLTQYSNCTNCPTGKFSVSTATTSIATCTGKCPTNSNSGTGSSVITDCQCNFGYTGPNDSM